MCSYYFMCITALSVDAKLHAFINNYFVHLILLLENFVNFSEKHKNSEHNIMLIQLVPIQYFRIK